MKLQKMVYFAHGLYLAAHDGKPLIVDSIEAWQFGPVIPSIYHKYAVFGNSLIVDKNELAEIDFYAESPATLDSDAQEIFDVTYDTLKDISAIQLSNWTHDSNSAWSQVYVEGTPHIDIPNELIVKDFQQFLTKPESAAT